MKTLIMCQGLPGSGKTTWARDQVNVDKLSQFVPLSHDPGYIPHVVRVNKDDIRAEWASRGWSWRQDKEAEVVAERDRRILDAFQKGVSIVISDDTNFGRKHKLRLAELARQVGAEFRIQRFDTPVDECIRRDALRTGTSHVGAAVIEKMAATYLQPSQAPTEAPATQQRFAKVEYNDDLMPAIITDLDGTLCLFEGMGHRGPYDATRCEEDACNLPIRRLLKTYSHYGLYQIIYVSGREDTYRPQTETWLRAHHLPIGPLYMRPEGDFRKDWIIKGEIFDAHIRGQYDVDFVLDDRNQVVDFWRSIGLTCFQVAKGDF